MAALKCLVAFVVVFQLCLCSGQQSYTNNAQLVVLDNKFKNNNPVVLEDIIFTTTSSKLTESSPCHQEVDLVWHATLPPLTSTPILVDLEGDGRKEIVVATSQHYIEIIQGEDGAKTRGWPFGFPKSSFISSPLTYDMDKDGYNDIVVVTVNGEIVFLRSSGEPLYNKTLVVPPLPVHKRWYEGLDSQNVDAAINLVKPTLAIEEDETLTSEAKTSMASMLEDLTAKDSKIDQTGFFTDPALQSLELFLPSNTPDSYITHLRTQQDPLYSPQYLLHLNTTILTWPLAKQRDYVLVDAHVLATPVIADLDADGRDELIVSVSYYFDQEFYSDSMNKATRIPHDVEIEKFVAGGLVVFDLERLEIKMEVINFDNNLDLDLTTDLTAYRAYMYASPTVVDLDRDGTLDVIVPTALGLVYAFDHEGIQRGHNFPILMDAVYAPVVAEDVDKDGVVELFVVDANSNIVCYNTKGEQLWESRVSGFPDEAPVIGDIDGDGALDIVVGTNEGHIWAFKARDGTVIPNYPVKLKGRIKSQLLLVDAETVPDSKGMHIVVHSLDGHVYILEGPTGCADKIDIGEPSYSMVLADDLTGNGFLDLLVTAKSGNIYCLGTSLPFRPEMAWLSQNQNRNGYTSAKHRGIYVTEQSRQFRDITGVHFYVAFEIFDAGYVSGKTAPYTVNIGYGATRLHSGTYPTPGEYRVEVQVPPIRAQVTIEVEMVTKSGQASFDTFGVSFNLEFHRTIKWIIIGPFVVISLVLLFVQDLKQQPLL